MRVPRTLALVLAGGKGSRLDCLTRDKPKPVLAVGGTYRLIDVALSNLVHSHLSDVGLVQQYLPHDLNDYLAAGRPWDLDRNHGGLQVLPPFEGAEGEGFAEGNADAIYRQRQVIEAFAPELVVVLSADHLYTLDFLDVITTHLDRRADLTIVTTQISEDASRYGVVQVDQHGRVTGFDYKPENPEGNLVATEVFVYTADVLLRALDTLVNEHGRLGDYGEQLVPYFVERGTAVEHRHTGYWLDLGTVQSYWTANLQLLDGDGASLDDPRWPIWSAQPQLLPARVGEGARVSNSLLAPGAQVAGVVEHSVVGVACVVEPGAVVRDSILLDGVRVGSGSVLVNCVVDQGATVKGRRGSEGVITLVDRDGTVATREPFDPTAVLPSSVPLGR